MISAGEELPELNVGEPKMGRVEQRVNDKAGELDLHNLPPPWVKKTRWRVKKTGCSPPFFQEDIRYAFMHSLLDVFCS